MINWYGYVWGIIIFLGNYFHLEAVLDGRAAPIYLESRYTFTNYEWVKGIVYFNQGFDLPVNGTIFFDSSDLINADINLNGGTIVFQNNIFLSSKASLSGQGFLDLRGNALRLRSDLTLSGSDRLYILSSGSIIGEADTVISPNSGAIICINGTSSFELSNVSLYNPTTQNFVTQEYVPKILQFNKATIILSQEITCTLFSRYVQIKNQLELKGSSLSSLQIVNQCKMIGGAQLSLFSGSKIIVNALSGVDSNSNIILDSATLQYTTTEPFFYLFSSLHPTTSSGLTMVFRGKNRLIYPIGAVAQFSTNAIMLFNPGARLILPLGSHLSVY